MKKLLTSASTLKVVDRNKDFMVYIDSSIEDLGGVIMQEGNVIFYKSQKLKEHEKNYVTVVGDTNELFQTIILILDTL